MGLIIRNIEHDQERPKSRTAGKSPGTIRKSHTTLTKHQVDEKTSDNQLYLPHQDDWKLDGTKHWTTTESNKGSNNQQRINNNRTTTLELSEA